MPSVPLPSAVPLYDAAAARRGDEAAVAAGDTWLELMERAAGHLARGVLGLAGRGYGLRVAVLVGKGDNGGDGWTAAPRLTAAGAQVRIVAVDGLEVETSDATTAGRTAWLRSVGRTSVGTGDLDAVLGWCDVAVDCLLGTGAHGAPRGPAAEGAAALRRAADRGTPVVACDVPSGVSADDGAAGEGAVRADLTVTFGARKRGLLLHPGAAHVGRVVVGDLGPRYDPGPTSWWALTPEGARPPELAVDADKRARGVVLAVAGAVGTSGAASLTATGALRAGAGLVTVAVPESVRAEVAARTDAGVMVRGLPASDDGEVAGAEGLPDLDGVDVVVAGPGLGHGPGAPALVAELRSRAPRLVLDADALNVHRDDPEALAEHAGELVLTPHERELARIGAGQDGPDAWASRVERVPELAARYRATVVAKGPGTIVAAPDGRVWVCPEGGPALGSGGTGDALAGIVAAAIARADDVPLATARAVWWHAAAGRRCGADRAGRATATDLLAALPSVLGDLDLRRWPT
ncbi:MAG: NAD(P)H-hydrate dehydratase [Nitriliruptor sp.]|uniref:NAD(P)H-hydrate dehydratase n=1 Tax=Nitriliruptor sp. TaxID=2448056 RepID=UPI0034A055C6